MRKQRKNVEFYTNGNGIYSLDTMVNYTQLISRCFFKAFYFFNYFFNVYLFWGEAETEGDTESQAGSRLCAVSTEANTGLEPTNGEIMA